MKKLVITAFLLALSALAAAPARLDYDPKVIMPASARLLELTACPVPSGFWAPLQEKGWVTECYVASGDLQILRLAVQLSLKKAGYRRESSEEQTLAGTTKFYIEVWKAPPRQLFTETFLFTDQNNAVFLIAHPPH